MSELFRVDVADGKYTVVMPKTGGLHALRYGEEWRDLTGDNLVYSLAAELHEAREKLATLREATK